MWDHFSDAEMQRRRALADALMDEHGLDALLLFGNSGVNRHNQANVFWLTNHLDLHHCYLVLPRDREASLLTGLANHVPNAREISDIRTVEWAATGRRRRSQNDWEPHAESGSSVSTRRSRWGCRTRTA